MAMNQIKFSHCCLKKQNVVSHNFILSDSNDDQIQYQNDIQDRKLINFKESDLMKIKK